MEEIKIHKLVRSKRKTIALVISPDATLTVRAPFHMPITYIENLVNKKRFWIKRKITEISSRPKFRSKEFVNGESFLYLGRIYRLKISDVERISLTENLVFPKTMLSNPVKYLKTWYKAQAEQKIKERVAWYAKLMGINYKSINITDANKRWGSCSQNGNLNFSWRLIMAPLNIIDYVAVHEIAHLTDKNHSKAFWRKVRLLIPDFEMHKRWLKDNEHLLNI